MGKFRYKYNVRSKPFWIWNIEEHTQQDVKSKGDCCFNHIIGLPAKDKMKKPMFDYQNCYTPK
jgi:hypothetical protein